MKLFGDTLSKIICWMLSENETSCQLLVILNYFLISKRFTVIWINNTLNSKLPGKIFIQLLSGFDELVVKSIKWFIWQQTRKDVVFWIRREQHWFVLCQRWHNDWNQPIGVWLLRLLQSQARFCRNEFLDRWNYKKWLAELWNSSYGCWTFSNHGKWCETDHVCSKFSSGKISDWKMSFNWFERIKTEIHTRQ